MGYHEALYDFLAKHLEAGRIDEAKDSLLIQVVDRAVELERKSRPKRLLIVAVKALLAFLSACFWELVPWAIRRKRQDPEEAARLAHLQQYLRSSL